MATVLTLPEICEFCRREVEALKRVIVLLAREEKRVAEVTFRESVEGANCSRLARDYGVERELVYHLMRKYPPEKGG